MLLLDNIFTRHNGQKRPKMAQTWKETAFWPTLTAYMKWIVCHNLLLASRQLGYYFIIIFDQLDIIFMGQNGQKEPKMAQNWK